MNIDLEGTDMIKLSTFNKLNISTKTRYTVHVGAAEGQMVDYFTVDYLEKDMDMLNKNILKRMRYEEQGAKVDMIDINGAAGCLNVTVII